MLLLYLAPWLGLRYSIIVRSNPKKTSGKINLDDLRAYVGKNPQATQKNIAKRFQCSYSTINKVIKSEGINYHLKHSKKLYVEEIRAYVEKNPKAMYCDIAKHFRCHKATVGVVIRTSGIDYSRKFSRKLYADELREHIQQHPEATQKDIAKHFKCDPSSVSSAIKAAGISYRPKACAPKSLSEHKKFSQKLQKYVQDNPSATQTEIAAFFKCNSGCISKALKTYGINYEKKRKDKPPFMTNPELLRTYIRDNPKASQTEIAGYFNCDASCVSRALKKFGIEYSNKFRGGIPAKLPFAPEQLRVYILDHPKATKAEISRHFKCDVYYISRAIKTYGINYAKRHGSGHSVESFLSPEKLRDYVNNNPEATQAEIARQFKCHYSCVSRALKVHGIDYRRKPSGYGAKSIISRPL